MLVFADTFVAETSTGDVIYDDEDSRRVDEYEFSLGGWLRRLRFTNDSRRAESVVKGS